ASYLRLLGISLRQESRVDEEGDRRLPGCRPLAGNMASHTTAWPGAAGDDWATTTLYPTLTWRLMLCEPPVRAADDVQATQPTPHPCVVPLATLCGGPGPPQDGVNHLGAIGPALPVRAWSAQQRAVRPAVCSRLVLARIA